ncbi:MAG: type II secretion system F family protein [Pseudomonadota bacterium]
MATFVYKVIHPDSRVRWGGGRFPFRDAESLTSFLERTGRTVVYAKPMPRPLEAVCEGYYRLAGRRIPAADLVEFLRNVGVMLQSGITFVDAVREAAGTTENKRLYNVSQGIAMGVESGLGVHAAMSRYQDVFPVQMLHIIRVGEASANMDKAFLAAAEHVRRINRIGVDVKKALIYPVIALVAVLLATIFWLYYTVPSMTDLYTQMGLDLPNITEWLLSVSAWVTENTVPIVIFLVILLLVARLLYVCNGECRFWWQNFVLRLPVFGRVSRNASIAYFAEYFSMLLQAGVSTYEALGIVAGTLDNEAYRKAVERVQEGVARGNSLSSEMARNRLFPGMVSRMVRTGEQTGTLPEQMEFIADEYASRLNDIIDRVKSLIEPLAIIIVGGLLLLIIFAMFYPVYNLIMEMSGTAI